MEFENSAIFKCQLAVKMRTGTFGTIQILCDGRLEGKVRQLCYVPKNLFGDFGVGPLIND